MTNGGADAPHPTADSVRLAWPDEAEQIAAIQRRAWAADGPVVAALLTAIQLPEMAGMWSAAILRPPQARFRVLVAVERGQVVGFATTTPGQDPDLDPTDGQLDELVVDPTARRRGHGSRLLNAAVDTLRTDGFASAVHWVGAQDTERQAFLSAAGWAVDGSSRTIGFEDEPTDATAPGVAVEPPIRLEQVRLHTSLAAEPA